MADTTGQAGGSGFTRYVTPLVAWALAFGCAVGWGSFVMPGSTFLPIAGPVGSALGLLVGAAVMLVIAMNYHNLIVRYPDAGGAFTFAKKILGYDHGFLCAWFLVLTYVAIIWANATALPLIGRNLLGGMLQFGASYEIAGFTIYLNEIGLSVLALLITGFVCLRGRLAGAVQVIMALLLAAGVAVCFLGVATQSPQGLAPLQEDPFGDYVPLIGLVNIIALAPWAFVGFESISHSAGEFAFEPRRSFRIMAVAVVTAGIAYALLALTAAMVQPDGYANWSSYIADIGNLSGAQGLPTLYAIKATMGDAGAAVMAIAAIGGIFTGLIGCCIAASRLLWALSRDHMVPSWFGQLNSWGVPTNAIFFVIGISLFIPFMGRTAISWIVDVTTVGAAIAYAYVSICAYRAAKEGDDSTAKGFAMAGIAVSAAFLLAFLVPNLLAVTTLSTESYLILATWGVLGFAFFRYVFKRDRERKMGHSAIVWIVLLSMILFTSLIWVRQSSENMAQDVAQRIEAAYVVSMEDDTDDMAETWVSQQMEQVSSTVQFDSLVQMALIVLALYFLFDIYSVMQERERQMEVEKALAEESSRAKTSFLSNMSHEIRTPMNAIIGLDSIALKDPDLSPRTRDQLEKIGGSAQHLLGLINDILDMSRIESGRMVLKDEEFLFRDFIDQVNVIINGQCEDKGLVYQCHIIGQTDDYYVGDDMKLKQVLINILGNSVKFTEAPGTVTFTVEQIAGFEGRRTLRFKMADTGIGMDAEYIPKIFEAFSQEDATTTNHYGGSGLGMAITKNLVEMMNGNIEVESEKGKGTTFTVTVTLKVSARSAHDEVASHPLDNLAVLVVDDDEVACEHAQLVLSELGVKAESCLSGTEALASVRSRRESGDPYDLVLTDFVMTRMDGVQLTREIRRLDPNHETAVIILTGYNFDDVTDEAVASGVDGILSKPLFTDTLKREIQRVVFQRRADELPEDTAGDLAGEDALEGTLAGIRVLLAEDVDINAEILMDLLDMEEISAERAENGQVAVDMFAASEPGHFDAVLMDVRMPVMDGLMAASTIRKLDHPDATRVPIIALTANAFDEDVQRSLQAGMNAHLSKPVEPDRLFETLRNLVPQKDE